MHNFLINKGVLRFLYTEFYGAESRGSNVRNWYEIRMVNCKLTYSFQVAALTTGFLTAAANSLILAPLIVKAMLKTFRLEVEAGITDVIGHADVTNLKMDPGYKAAYRMFRRCHGLSALLTLLGLASNSVHLYYLTCQCVPI